LKTLRTNRGGLRYAMPAPGGGDGPY
jgi:hypothetical protein